MDRRTACLTLAAVSSLAAIPLRAQSVRTARVAWVSVVRAYPDSPYLASFRSGMQALGWVEGRNLVIDTWWGGGSVERLKKLVPEVVASRPDVIVATGGPTVTLIDSSVQLPIVFTYSADVVVGKVVESWARPGGNRTGISFFSLELGPKRLELMKELLPGMKRVAIVGWPPHAGELIELQTLTTAAEKLGLEHRYYGCGIRSRARQGLRVHRAVEGRRNPRYRGQDRRGKRRALCGVRGAEPHPDGVVMGGSRGNGQPDDLRTRASGKLRAPGLVSRSHSQGHKTRGHPGRAAHQV